MQIAAENEFLPWVDINVLVMLIQRQMNPIYQSSWMSGARGQVASNMAKLDICLTLAAVSSGYTHEQVVKRAQKLQSHLTGAEL